jgi:hypothetical protein
LDITFLGKFAGKPIDKTFTYPYSKLRKPTKSWSFSGIQSFEYEQPFDWRVSQK